MFSSSFSLKKSKSRKENCKYTSRLPANSGGSEEELKNRIAVRFLIKKSKRFDDRKEQLQQKLQKVDTMKKAEPSQECLQYLGLSPAKEGTRNKLDVPAKRQLDFDFLKPQVYECCFCTKFFFHKSLFRKHMLRHLKQTTHWCSKCNRGFASRASKKKHDILYH